MKKIYISPAVSLTGVRLRSLMLGSNVRTQGRWSTVQAATGVWQEQGFQVNIVDKADFLLTTKGQSSDGTGSRAKGSVWDAWDD